MSVRTTCFIFICSEHHNLIARTHARACVLLVNTPAAPAGPQQFGNRRLAPPRAALAAVGRHRPQRTVHAAQRQRRQRAQHRLAFFQRLCVFCARGCSEGVRAQRNVSGGSTRSIGWLFYTPVCIHVRLCETE